MNTLETLYFPDTVIDSDRQFPLFLPFSTVHYIQPIEADEQTEDRSMDTFMDSQFCQAHTPHPLGKDRDRFLYLINDIKNRKDDYASQLSNLALASMGTTRTAGDSTKQEIVSSIAGRKTTTEKHSNDKELEALWQARLILKIAEILDREEEEVAEALVQLEESEIDLFDRLQGKEEHNEDENLYEELNKIKSKLGKPRTASIQNRLRAWLRLIKNYASPYYPVWTTSRQEAADVFFENHEKKKSCAPTLIAELDLPARTGRNNDKVLEKFIAFRSESQEHLKTFYKLLCNATEDLSGNNDYNSFSLNWERILDIHFPAASFGRATIKFYYFQDHLTEFTGSTAGQKETDCHILAVFAS